MSIENKVIGLAGLVQAVTLVQTLADDGQCDNNAFQTCMASVFKLDVDNAIDIYGGVDNLQLGLKTLHALLENLSHDMKTSRLMVAVLQLERRLSKDPAMLQALQNGIKDCERARIAMGENSDSVHDRLAGLYTDTLSKLKPSIVVHGNNVFLTQSRVIARIRTLLLAAVRAAVLWRQSGGSAWTLVFQRGKLNKEAKRLQST